MREGGTEQTNFINLTFSPQHFLNCGLTPVLCMRNYHVVATIIRRWDLLKCERSNLITLSPCLPLFAFSETPSPCQCKQYETVTLLTLKIRFLMLMLCPVSFTTSSLEEGGRCQMVLSPVRDIIETAHITLFFVVTSNVQCFC